MSKFKFQNLNCPVTPDLVRRRRFRPGKVVWQTLAVPVSRVAAGTLRRSCQGTDTARVKNRRFYGGFVDDKFGKNRRFDPCGTRALVVGEVHSPTTRSGSSKTVLGHGYCKGLVLLAVDDTAPAQSPIWSNLQNSPKTAPPQTRQAGPWPVWSRGSADRPGPPHGGPGPRKPRLTLDL